MRTAYRIGSLVLTVMLFVAPGVARGQSADAGATAVRTYGTAATVSHTIPAVAFRGLTAGATYDLNAFTQFCTGVNVCTLQAGALLPAGALITAFELEACDTSLFGSVDAAIYRISKDGGGSVNALELAHPATSSIGNPGCVSIIENLATLHTVDNAANSYAVNARITSTQPLSSVLSLVASGITNGCSASPPLYCPDNPVTRGQLAKFLGQALGLHFTP